MTVQWTVSFKKDALSARGLKLLEDFEHVELERQGNLEIDMEESEFFSFAEEARARLILVPVDGSNSWGKHL